MAAEDILYQMATQRLDAQMRRIDGLDAKVATAFVFSSSILAFFGVLVSLSALPSHPGVRIAFVLLVAFAVLIYAALLLCLYRAYEVNARLSYRPDPDTMERYARRLSPPQMQVWVARECIASITINEPSIARKARWLQGALLLVPVEAIFLVIAALVDLFSK